MGWLVQAVSYERDDRPRPSVSLSAETERDDSSSLSLINIPSLKSTYHKSIARDICKSLYNVTLIFSYDLSDLLCCLLLDPCLTFNGYYTRVPAKSVVVLGRYPCMLAAVCAMSLVQL